MRKVLILIVFVCLGACCKTNTENVGKTIETEIKVDTVLKIDTIYVEVVKIDSTGVKELEEALKVCRAERDSINKTIGLENYLNARKLEKIQYYINITERNSKNKKFFYGWIKRTMANQ